MIKVLRGSERKKILKILDEKFGFNDLKNFYILKSGKNRIRIISKDFERVDLRGMRIKFLGLEFGILTKDDEFRLTIEGSQFVGKGAKKNILEVERNVGKQWMSGRTPRVTGNVENGFVIVKHERHILGCGRYAEGKLWSFVPKWRRVLIF